jgi:hypothetical protein
MDPQELISVYTVTNPVEAEIVRNALLAEGIACEVSFENQAALTGITDIAILTRAIDADRARKILEKHEHKHHKH